VGLRARWVAATPFIAVVALVGGAAARASDASVDPVPIGASDMRSIDEAKPLGGSVRAADEKEEGAQAKAATPKAPRSLFRCWQYGRLIFEGRGYGALPQSQIAVELKPADGASGRVQVLDMYEGLCILELPK
jgi:hypothetical protein